MSARKYLEALPLADMAVYRSNLNYRDSSVRYTGAPRKHPYDRDKVLIITQPFSADAVFYEFRVTDITHVDNLPSLVSENGESVQMVHLWVRRGSLAVRFQAFQVTESPA